MMKQDKDFWLNSPVFLKYKDRFDFRKFGKVSRLKKVYLNERIVEVPFAIDALGRKGTCKKVLDFGCSASPLSLYLACLGYEVVGLDLRNYPYYSPNFQFVQGNILEDDFSAFDEDQFDAVLCVSTLEHVGLGSYQEPKEQQSPEKKALRKLSHYLKKDGLFVLTVPFGVSQVQDFQRYYSASELLDILQDFTIQEMKYFCTNSRKDCRSNHWEEIPLEKAEGIRSDDRVQCISCITATNNK